MNRGAADLVVGVEEGLGRQRAQVGAFERITDAIIAGRLTVPIAATFPIEQIRDAVTLQSGGHVHGKVVVTLYQRSLPQHLLTS